MTNNAGGASVTADGAGMKSLAASWALATDAGWGAGTTHSLTAASPVSPFFDPNTQYTFSGWTDGITTATRSIVVPASGLLSLGANYSVSYHATANVNSACAGSTSFSPLPPANGFVANGTPLTVIATPTAPFVFTGWGGTLSGSANPLATTATGEVIATAIFNLVSAPLTVTSITPASLPAGSPAQTITVSGTGFTPANTYAFVNLSNRPAAYVNSNTLTVSLTAADLASAGILTTIVENYQNSCAVDAPGPAFLVTP